MARVVAGNEGIEPFNLVRKAMLDEKIQCSVYNRGLRSKIFFSQAIKNLIGTEGAMFGEQHFEHAPAYLRELKAFRFAVSFNGLDPMVDAAGMVMLFETNRIHD